MKKSAAAVSELTVEAFLYTDKRPLGFMLSAAARIAVSAVGAMGAAFTFLTSLDTGVGFFAPAALIIVSCLLFGTALCLSKKYILPALAALFSVYAVFVRVFRDQFCNGLANVVNIYLARVKSEYEEDPFFYLISPDTAAKDTQIFVNITVIFIALSFSYGIVYKSSLPAVLPVSVIPAELCLYFGLSPSYTAFFALIASWFAVFALDLSSPGDGKAYKKAAAQCGSAAALFLLLCAGLSFAAMRLSGYTRPERLDDISRGAVDYFQGGGFSEDIAEIKIADLLKRDSTIDHGKLGHNGNITFDNKTALMVTIPKTSETVYLRGFVGSVYTGNSWEELPRASVSELQSINESFQTEGLNTLLLPSFNLKKTKSNITEQSFSVKNINADSRCLYMPYYIVPESVSRYEIKNDAFASNGEDAWFGRVYDPSSVYGYRMLLNSAWVVPSASLAEDQNVYRNFVNRNYLDVPDNFKAADEIFDSRYYDFISAEPEESGKSTLTDAVVFGRKLYYIKSWLRANCEYSLKAGTLPAGKDFADFFLTETKKGSCTHFATSAVLLCRRAGIPARYAEGYVIKPGDFDEEASFGALCTVDVTDARAHAWAEVYIGGFGWYPIEFTSGYGNVITAVTTVPNAVTEPSETEVSEAETTEAPEETSVSEIEEVSENEIAGTGETTAFSGTEQPAGTSPPEDAVPGGYYSETEKPTVGFSAFGSKNGKKRDIVYDLTVFILIMLVISSVTAIFGIRRILKVRSCRKALYMENEKAARNIYSRFIKLAKAAGIKRTEENISYDEYIKLLENGSPCFSDGTAKTVVNTALKAEFGGGCVTKEEIKEMYSAVNHAVKRYESSLSGLRRFYFRFIEGIV